MTCFFVSFRNMAICPTGSLSMLVIRSGCQ